MIFQYKVPCRQLCLHFEEQSQHRREIPPIKLTIQVGSLCLKKFYRAFKGILSSRHDCQLFKIECSPCHFVSKNFVKNLVLKRSQWKEVITRGKARNLEDNKAQSVSSVLIGKIRTHPFFATTFVPSKIPDIICKPKTRLTISAILSMSTKSVHKACSLTLACQAAATACYLN